MNVKELEIYHAPTKKTVKCLCINYENFSLDCDKLIKDRYRKFNLNPKNRFEIKMEHLIDEIMFHVRSIPYHFCLRLENRYTICNCRIDYSFDIVTKEFLQEEWKEHDLTEEEVNVCLHIDSDYIVVYVGMNQ